MWNANNLIKMSSKYDTIGVGYNNTRKADPYLTERLIDLLHQKDNSLFNNITMQKIFGSLLITFGVGN
jgi:hypothetical protein